MQRAGVLAREPALVPDSLCELEILDSEHRMRFEHAAQLESDILIARANHPLVKLVQQQQISEPKDGVSVQYFGDSREMSAALDVPLDDSQERLQSRAGIWKFIHSRFVQQPAKLRLVLAIELRLAELLECGEALDLIDEMPVVGEGVLGDRGCHPAEICPVEAADNLKRTT